MASNTITLNFVKTLDEVGIVLSLSLDTVANKDKTTFVIGDKVYLKFLSSVDEPYTIEVNMGTAKTEATNIHYPIEDDEITFANTNSGSLGYVPIGEVDYEWIGKSAGTPVFNGREILLDEDSVAVLNCSYKTKGNRLSVTNSEVGTVLVVVIQGENQASLSITFEDDEDDEEEKEPVAYELDVKNYCSDASLSGVTVYLDEIDIGQTNINGIIALGALIPGSAHTLKMMKAGYIDSDKDKLNNDSFTVPS